MNFVGFRPRFFLKLLLLIKIFRNSIILGSPTSRELQVTAQFCLSWCELLQDMKTFSGHELSIFGRKERTGAAPSKHS